MIRVISGRFRGRGIPSPRGRQVRPTTAKIRESIFNRLQWRLPDCRFLDLFAGSGIMGLEALSRGAAFTLAVEQDRAQCRSIRNSYEAFGLTEKDAKALTAEVGSFLGQSCRETPFDLIFMDPPYGYTGLAELTQLCLENGWLNDGGVIVIEHATRDPELPGFTRAVYGDTAVSWLES